MSKINISADLLAKLKHLSDSGDVLGEALYLALENELVCSLSAAVKVGNVITVTGKVTKNDGTVLTAAQNLVAESFPVVGAGTIAVHAAGGTAKVGSGTKVLWLQTNADGTFILDVTDATGGDPCLLRITCDQGLVETIALGF